MVGSGPKAMGDNSSPTQNVQEKEVSESNHFNEVIKDLKTVLLKHHTLIKEVCDDIGKEHQESSVLRTVIRIYPLMYTLHLVLCIAAYVYTQPYIYHMYTIYNT